MANQPSLLSIFIACCWAILSMALNPRALNAQTKSGASFESTPWHRHTIDHSFRGADGVRLGDFNRDGLQDIVTGWEESGVIRLYLNPGPSQSKNAWPAVTVGKASSVEDAFACDLDNDGCLEIISCHEGKQREVIIHRNQSQKTDNKNILAPNNWQSTPIRELDNEQWMFGNVIELANQSTALVFGSKNKNASLTLIHPILSNGKVTFSKPNRLRDCGWIMSIAVLDFDGDGDNDIVFSDRKTGTRCVGYFEQTQQNQKTSWGFHSLTNSQAKLPFEPMFVEANPNDVLVATRNNQILHWQGQPAAKPESTLNPTGVRFGKAIKRISPSQWILTCNTAADRTVDLPAIWQWKNRKWSAIDPTLNCKFDRIELIDLDADGDLDVLTCEERQNLGVVWYENPN